MYLIFKNSNSCCSSSRTSSEVILDAVNINSSSGVSCESNCSNNNINAKLTPKVAYHHQQQQPAYQDKSQLYYLHWSSSDNNSTSTTTNNKNPPNNIKNENDLNLNAKFSPDGDSPMSKLSNISDYTGRLACIDDISQNRLNKANNNNNNVCLDQRISCYSDLMSSSTASTLKNRDGRSSVLVCKDSYLKNTNINNTNNKPFKITDR